MTASPDSDLSPRTPRVSQYEKMQQELTKRDRAAAIALAQLDNFIASDNIEPIERNITAAQRQEVARISKLPRERLWHDQYEAAQSQSPDTALPTHHAWHTLPPVFVPYGKYGEFIHPQLVFFLADLSSDDGTQLALRANFDQDAHFGGAIAEDEREYFDPWLYDPLLYPAKSPYVYTEKHSAQIEARLKDKNIDLYYYPQVLFDREPESLRARRVVYEEEQSALFKQHYGIDLPYTLRLWFCYHVRPSCFFRPEIIAALGLSERLFDRLWLYLSLHTGFSLLPQWTQQLRYYVLHGAWPTDPMPPEFNVDCSIPLQQFFLNHLGNIGRAVEDLFARWETLGPAVPYHHFGTHIPYFSTKIISGIFLRMRYDLALQRQVMWPEADARTAQFDPRYQLTNTGRKITKEMFYPVASYPSSPVPVWEVFRHLNRFSSFAYAPKDAFLPLPHESGSMRNAVLGIYEREARIRLLQEYYLLRECQFFRLIFNDILKTLQTPFRLWEKQLRQNSMNFKGTLPHNMWSRTHDEIFACVTWPAPSMLPLTGWSADNDLLLPDDGTKLLKETWRFYPHSLHIQDLATLIFRNSTNAQNWQWIFNRNEDLNVELFAVQWQQQSLSTALMSMIRGMAGPSFDPDAVPEQTYEQIRAKDRAMAALAIAQHKDGNFDRYLDQVRREGHINPEVTYDKVIIDAQNGRAYMLSREFIQISDIFHSARMFIVCGDVGSGKTVLCHCIANQLLKQLRDDQRMRSTMPKNGGQVVALTTLDELYRMRMFIYGEPYEERMAREKKFNRYMKAGLLMIDGLCDQMQALDLPQQKLFNEIMRYRAQEHLPVVITTPIAIGALHKSIGDTCFEAIKSFMVMATALLGASRREFLYVDGAMIS